MIETYREEFRKLMRAYAGFQAATALIVVSKAADFCMARIIISLFAISIPSTLAYAGFARLTPEDEKRNPAVVMAICFFCAFFTSVAAISLMLASASTFAAIAFPVTCAAWFVVI